MRAASVLTVLALAAGFLAGCTDEARDVLSPKPTGCLIGAGAEPLHLTSEQTFHAATIAAVGQRDGMDERAVAVAIATAFQESSLSNVDYGHHDSLGLFQQRPSVGWGTEEEVLDPVYASFKFYEKLRRTEGWEQMRIGDAAQAVQVSAYPEEYHKWEDEAFAVAAAFAGGQAAGASCIGGGLEEKSSDADSLAADYAEQWGQEAAGADGGVVTIAADDDRAGWSRASWAVAKSYAFDIASVSFAGRQWEPGEQGWTAPGGELARADAADESLVIITLDDAV